MHVAYSVAWTHLSLITESRLSDGWFSCPIIPVSETKLCGFAVPAGNDGRQRVFFYGDFWLRRTMTGRPIAFQRFYKRVRELMPSDYWWLTLWLSHHIDKYADMKKEQKEQEKELESAGEGANMLLLIYWFQVCFFFANIRNHCKSTWTCWKGACWKGSICIHSCIPTSSTTFLFHIAFHFPR